jgi:hypothetical protein
MAADTEAGMEIKEHLLACNSLVMGTCNILIIGLPLGWRVVGGFARPEVDRWMDYRRARWATAAMAPYKLVEAHPEDRSLARAEVDLLVSVSPPRPLQATNGLAEVADSREEEVYRHDGAWARGAVTRGFLPSRRVPALHLEWSCEYTGRRIRLELAANLRARQPTATGEDLTRLLEAIKQGLQCH